MKVLLVWEEIPETTSFYLLDGEAAEVAIEAHNQIINSSEETDAAERLSEMLIGVEKIPYDQHPFETGENVKVVFAGFIL